MSIDPHWFSTLFGWYTFSGMWVSALIIFNLLTIYLKSKGYLPNVNENHIHDLGKWMFALSILCGFFFVHLSVFFSGSWKKTLTIIYQIKSKKRQLVLRIQ